MLRDNVRVELGYRVASLLSVHIFVADRSEMTYVSIQYLFNDVAKV